MESKEIALFLSKNFQIGKARKIKKVFDAMKKFSEKDVFFADALMQLNIATYTEKLEMCEYLFKIYNDALKDNLSLETYLLLIKFAE